MHVRLPVMRLLAPPCCRVLLPAMTLLLIGGCAAKPAAIDNPLSIKAAQYDDAYEAAKLVLREHGFDLDRQDYRFGRVSSQPLGAPSAVEFWRGSNTTGGQAIDSTLNDQRRIVTVSLNPTEPEGESPTYTLGIEVMLERHEHPMWQLTGSTAPNRMVNRLTAVPTAWRERGITATYWLPTQRDPHLEQRLMHAIVEQMNEQARAQTRR